MLTSWARRVDDPSRALPSCIRELSAGRGNALSARMLLLKFWARDRRIRRKELPCAGAIDRGRWRGRAKVDGGSRDMRPSVDAGRSYGDKLASPQVLALMTSAIRPGGKASPTAPSSWLSGAELKKWSARQTLAGRHGLSLSPHDPSSSADFARGRLRNTLTVVASQMFAQSRPAVVQLGTAWDGAGVL